MKRLGATMTTAAIFIDLDNFWIPAYNYIEPAFAMTLMRDVEQWTRALRNYDKKHGGSRRVHRDIVVQKCYFGEKFWRDISSITRESEGFSGIDYRQRFLDARYEMVLCRELTGRGKNAADIKMAIDAIKVIQKYPLLDEIYILAGDADYLPLVEEARRVGLRVFYIQFGKACGKLYRRELEWLGAVALSDVDFYLLLDTLIQDYPELTQSDMDVMAVLEPLLKAAANKRQGFLPNYEIFDIIDKLEESEVDKKTLWEEHQTVNLLIEHMGQHYHEWLRVDSERQGVRIRNEDLDISKWNVSEDLRQFVISTLVEIDDPIPYMSPAQFKAAFSAIASGVAKGTSPKGIADNVLTKVRLQVGEPCDSDNAMRIVSTILSFNTGKKAMTATEYATIWRMEIYNLARDSSFMNTPAGHRHLCEWFAVEGENIAQAAEKLRSAMASSA
jgi:uncharacterized LabA/DUF88 family protein